VASVKRSTIERNAGMRAFHGANTAARRTRGIVAARRAQISHAGRRSARARYHLHARTPPHLLTRNIACLHRSDTALPASTPHRNEHARHLFANPSSSRAANHCRRHNAWALTAHNARARSYQRAGKTFGRTWQWKR